MKRIASTTLLGCLVWLFHLSACSPFDADRFNPEEHSFQGEGSTFFFPMVITPDGDGLNDEYQMIISTPDGEQLDSVTYFRLQVRKDGILKYSTEDFRFRWNGTSPSGNKVRGMTEVEFFLGVNEKEPFCGKTKLLIFRGSCIPQSLVGAMFPDMVDARYGAIYQTQESVCP